MSQQGGRPGGPTGPGPEDDWWGQLYDDASDDTGPAPAADSLDDRFASAAGTVNAGGPGAGADWPPAPDPRETPVPREAPVSREAPGAPVLPAQRRTPPPVPEATPPAQPPGAPDTAPPAAPSAPTPRLPGAPGVPAPGVRHAEPAGSGRPRRPPSRAEPAPSAS
ncbi:hypothetical protein STENM223S_01616 [Streptomyces tendae]